ncbi:MAG: hypothetical protein QOJ80_6428 [Mycobacterium sp.]|jgi:hypothetical protein|nr:hypothetical protein [Mycobacterium sp.]
MTSNGPLTPADDHVNRQFSDTFSVVAQTHRNWTEWVCTTAFPDIGLTAERSFI